jgi:hypothetical protein
MYQSRRRGIVGGNACGAARGGQEPFRISMCSHWQGANDFDKSNNAAWSLSVAPRFMKRIAITANRTTLTTALATNEASVLAADSRDTCSVALLSLGQIKSRVAARRILLSNQATQSGIRLSTYVTPGVRGFRAAQSCRGRGGSRMCRRELFIPSPPALWL